jgi:hypothetical protein
MRDRFFNRRSYRFYFLCVRDEILLYGYMRDKVRASRFSVRIRKRLLMQVSRAARSTKALPAVATVKSDLPHFWCSLKQKAPN